jgi:Membrane proteins related to metalloendopeptidases
MNGPLYGKFRVTQIFKGQVHKGLDLVGMESKEIHATINGLVEVAGWDAKTGSSTVDQTYGMGQYVRIREDTTNYRYYFAHMSKLLVLPGQRVKKGELIGIEGSTGHSTGPHVHYEIRKSPDNSTFLDVSQLSGIPNALGEYVQDAPDGNSLEDMKKIVQSKAGLDDNTMKYMDAYRYGDDLIRKLYLAML